MLKIGLFRVQKQTHQSISYRAFGNGVKRLHRIFQMLVPRNRWIGKGLASQPKGKLVSRVCQNMEKELARPASVHAQCLQVSSNSLQGWEEPAIALPMLRRFYLRPS